MIENSEKKKLMAVNEAKNIEVKDYFSKKKKSLLGNYLKKKNVIAKNEIQDDDTSRQLKFDSEDKKMLDDLGKTPVSLFKNNFLEVTQNGMNPADPNQTKGSLISRTKKSPFFKGNKINKSLIGGFLLFNDGVKKPKVNKNLINEYIIIPIVSKDIIDKFLNGLSEYQADLSKKINESLGKNEKYFQSLAGDEKNKANEFNKMIMDRITNLENQNQLLLKYTEFLYKKYESSKEFESDTSEDELNNSPLIEKYFN